MVRSDDRNDLWSSKNLVASASSSQLNITSRISVKRKLKKKFCKYLVDTRVPVGYETCMYSMWGSLSLTTHCIMFIMERSWVCPFVLTLNTTNWICSGVCWCFCSMTTTGEKSGRARKRCLVFNLRWIKFTIHLIHREYLVHWFNSTNTRAQSCVPCCCLGSSLFGKVFPELQYKREFPHLVVTVIWRERSMAWGRYVFVYVAEALSNQWEPLASAMLFETETEKFCFDYVAEVLIELLIWKWLLPRTVDMNFIPDQLHGMKVVTVQFLVSGVKLHWSPCLSHYFNGFSLHIYISDILISS